MPKNRQHYRKIKYPDKVTKQKRLVFVRIFLFSSVGSRNAYFPTAPFGYYIKCRRGSTSQLKFEGNMKVNMNIIVGGTDDILDNILSAARTVRKEMKKTFENIEIETLQKMDICVCLSGNISKYYPKSGIYQARYYSKAKKFMVYIHFSLNEWDSKKIESVSKFLKMYKDYLLELSDIIKTKTTKYKPDFDSRCYEDGVRRVFGNLNL